MLLPSECKNNTVCAWVLALQAANMGNRLRCIHQHIGDDGSVNWVAGGCFSFEWAENGLAKAVKHCQGLVAEIPAHLVITKQFQMWDNWGDRSAFVTRSPVTYYLSTIFPPNDGPNRFAVAKGKDSPLIGVARAAQLECEWEVRQARVGRLTEQKDMVEEVWAEKRQANTCKARVARKATQEQKKRARTIALSTY